MRPVTGPRFADPEAAFRDTWRNIAIAAERGLADAGYPDEERDSLYRIVAAARECTELGWEAMR